MEDLTKQQIVLVTLLVSFVTSIATGIVTVSLMDQAPKAVTQTINRVVERTIEKVVPATNQSAAVITKETVVVKEDDYVTQSVDKNIASFVRIKKVDGQGSSAFDTFVGLGLIVTKDGVIVTDSSVVAPQTDDSGTQIFGHFEAVMSDGKIYDLTRVGSNYDVGITLYQIVQKEGEKRITFALAVIGNSDNLKLGQTIITLGGEDQDSVSVGIVQSVIVKNNSNSTATSTATSTVKTNLVKNVIAIKTDLKQTNETAGSVLLDLYGNVVGLKAGSELYNPNSYLPANMVSASVSKVLSGVSATTTPAKIN
ncbi:MAG: serine protease [Candidatus Paceibacterota bacterium]